MTCQRRAAYELGGAAERLVANALERSGWQVLATNWRGGRGEIDIVASKGGCLRFVEVKARATVSQGIDALTLAKRRRLVSAANTWLMKNPTSEDEVCFMLAVVAGQGFRDIEWIDNPFDEA